MKVGKLEGLKGGFRFATAAEIDAHFGCKPGYLGPIGLKQPLKIIADRTVANMADFVCGANEADFHFTGANWGRDLPEPDLVADIRNVVEGDPSPDGKGVLAIQRGIEVGHVFYLGTKYSAAMNASYLDENGKPQLMEMGCYGIGVTRILGAAIEQNHDERGIVWPDAIAPFTVVVCPIGMDRSEEVKAAATKLHEELLDLGIDVLLDDRGERPGAMFADWEPGRRAAPRGDLRSRPQGRPGRVSGPPRCRRDQAAAGRGHRSSEATPGVNPARPPQRVAAVDALRAIALFPVIAVNWVGYPALPDAGPLSPPSPADGIVAQVISWFLHALIAGKGIALLAFLFGYSQGLSQSRGDEALGKRRRRLVKMLTLGLLHGTFSTWATS